MVSFVKKMCTPAFVNCGKLVSQLGDSSVSKLCGMNAFGWLSCILLMVNANYS